MALPLPPSDLIPVTLLTGFLGSGKTTLLNKLLSHPDTEETAVLINEFGEVGLDHLLVREVSETIVLLESGCLCCSVRGDMIDALRDLFLKRVRGEVPEFRRVVIETTGMADPAPVIHTLMTDPLLGARYRLDGIITTLDALNADGQLDKHPEALKQAAVADRIVLTKTDLTGDGKTDALLARIKHLNPSARTVCAINGEIDPAIIFESGLFHSRTGKPNIESWLGEEKEHGHENNHGHDTRIGSFCLTLDTPIPWQPFTEWFDMLLTSRGENILRVKGILDVVGEENPIAIHGVQHVFHPPAPLPGWRGDVKRSRIVFITRDLGRKAIEDSFHAFLGLPR